MNKKIILLGGLGIVTGTLLYSVIKKPKKSSFGIIMGGAYPGSKYILPKSIFNK